MEKNNSNKYPDPDVLSSKNTVSSTESTGLMHRMPVQDDDVEGYKDIYDSIPEQGNIEEFRENFKKQLKD